MKDIEVNANDLYPVSEPVTKSSRNPIKWFQQLPPAKKIAVLVGIAACIGVLCFAGTYIYIINRPNAKQQGNQTANKTTPTPSPTPTPTPVYNPINGAPVDAQHANNLTRSPLAVMIENSVPARPQTGLNDADVVYEALAEGGITRFMAVFLQNTPQQVGPVRSARTYYLDYASEYNPLYVHWGGNSDALTEIPQIGIHNLDAITSSGSDTSCQNDTSTLFCRDESRGAPHNGYGIMAQIWNYAQSQGWSFPSGFVSWQFKEDNPQAKRGPDGQTISIQFASDDADYDVKWVYNQSQNVYTRYNGGTLQVDRATNDPITTKTLVVEYVTGNLYDSTSGKEVWHLNNSGTGKVSVFTDGKEVDGIWKKSSMTDRTQFIDTAGNQIPLNRGKIWITIVQPDQGTVTLGQ